MAPSVKGVVFKGTVATTHLTKPPVTKQPYINTSQHHHHRSDASLHHPPPSSCLHVAPPPPSPRDPRRTFPTAKLSSSTASMAATRTLRSFLLLATATATTITTTFAAPARQARAATTNHVLLTGDSFASFAGNTVPAFCNGVSATNKGIGGTTAAEWNDQAVQEVLREAPGRYTHILHSVGGNDFLNTGCTISKDALVRMIDASIKAVRRNAPSGAQIVMAGYTLPSNALEECSIYSPQAAASKMSAVLNGAVKQAAAQNSGVTFIDNVGQLVGGSSSSFSSSKYFVDATHLNARGYCKLWTTPSAQAAFGCAAATYDCSQGSQGVKVGSGNGSTSTPPKCTDDDAGVVAFGKQNGISVSGCSDNTAMQYCTMAEVVALCCRSCGGGKNTLKPSTTVTKKHIAATNAPVSNAPACNSAALDAANAKLSQLRAQIATATATLSKRGCKPKPTTKAPATTTKKPITTEKTTTAKPSSTAKPGVGFYKVHEVSGCDDAHTVGVTEITSSTGGFVGAGKGLNENDKGTECAFAVRTDKSGKKLWQRTWNTKGQRDWMVSAASNTQGTVIFLAGGLGKNGSMERALIKLDASTGSTIWDKRWAPSSSTRISAFEAVATAANGDLLACGVVNARSLDGFKSAGNPGGGTAFIARYSAASMAKTTAPGSTEHVFFKSFSAMESCRQLRETSSGDLVFLLGREDGGAVLRTDSLGSQVWQKAFTGYEPTDMEVSASDGTFRVIGHGYAKKGQRDGTMVKITASGSVAWQKWYGNPSGGVGAYKNLNSGIGSSNDLRAINDECWGVAPTRDGGFAMACGTGIEGSESCGAAGLTGATKTACENDPRTLWRSLIIKVDASGGIVWQRVDSAATFTGGSAHDTASEFIVATRDGGLMAAQDEGGYGIGLLKLTGQ